MKIFNIKIYNCRNFLGYFVPLMVIFVIFLCAAIIAYIYDYKEVDCGNVIIGEINHNLYWNTYIFNVTYDIQICTNETSIYEFKFKTKTENTRQKFLDGEYVCYYEPWYRGICSSKISLNKISDERSQIITVTITLCVVTFFILVMILHALDCKKYNEIEEGNSENNFNTNTPGNDENNISTNTPGND